MTTKIICYGGRSAYESKTLNRSQAYTLSVIEHVLGSNQFLVQPSNENFNEILVNRLKSEDFLISENFFTKLVGDGIIKPSTVFSREDLHNTINICKAHTSDEWEALDVENT
ncbi:hypothetical protein D3C75_670100 [compost metagenome]